MGLQISRRWASVALGCMAVTLAACQGNLGSGSGLSIPQAPSYGQPGGPAGGAGSQSRQQILEGADYMTPTTTEVPLPPLQGFSIAVALGTAPPSAAPGESSGTSAAGAAAGGAPASAVHKHTSAVRPGASASPAAPASPSAAGSPNPASSPGSASSAAPTVKPSGGARPSPSPTGSKIETKTIVYPDDAPNAPTPMPTGNVQTFTKRTAIVRGYLMPSQDITLYGLGAVRFTIPTTEEIPQRGFTVAVYQSGKHHHEKLLDADTDAPLVNDVVASGRSDSPIVLKKDIGYLLMLYGDDTPATPAPVQPGYPTPGNNPFPVPSTYGSSQPGYPGQPTYPPGSVNPYATPTPFR